MTTPDPARATPPRDGPERRVVPVPPEWLAEWEAWATAEDGPAMPGLHRSRARELLRYVRALEREIADHRGGRW
jgi:hypothetical protein